MKIRILDLMKKSGVKFGTSGARGQVKDITDKVAYTYTKGFISFLEESENDFKEIGIAGDYRKSTDRIMKAVGKAILDCKYQVINYGKIPSPALAYIGLEKKIPTIMITGSHIPEDRNGIKYNKLSGEIMKPDEKLIKKQVINLNESIFNKNGYLIEENILPPVNEKAKKIYKDRYIKFFGVNSLQNLKLGLYEHSSVGREIFYDILTSLGAQVNKFGFSETFIPVDTEAIRGEDQKLAKEWIGEKNLDYIISADGDADRPLLSDEKGNWLRGDILGILAAKFLEIDAIATPVSCNSAVEKSSFFKKVKRTKIGSPYVIAAMKNLKGKVAGYEANGGFLLNTSLNSLKPLPTRDAILPIIATIILSINENKPISQLIDALPLRFTSSNRVKNFPTEKSKKILKQILDNSSPEREIEKIFANISGKVKSINTTDGIRVTFENEEVIHLRPSGNAPEFRCYNEADSETRAIKLNEKCINILKSMK